MDRRTPTDQSVTQTDVAAELTEMSLNGLFRIVVMSAFCFVGSTAIIAHNYRDRFLWYLATIMGVLGLVRSIMALRTQRSRRYREALLGSKMRRAWFEIVPLLYFSSLAASTSWNFYQRRPDAEVLCTLGTFMFCSAISARINASPFSAKLQGLVMLLVLMICFFKPHDELAMTAEALIVVFGYAHCRAVQTKYDTVVALIRNQRELRLISERDSLTGLVNRRGFEDALNGLCRSPSTFAFLSVDLDRFKAVNDKHGHAAGDELLRQVGKRLLSIVRANDIVARLGGDEFAILQLPVTERGNAEALAERVTVVLGQSFNIGEISVNIGASVGISLASLGDLVPATILKRADDALYQAKQAGRGRFVCGEAKTFLIAHSPP